MSTNPTYTLSGNTITETKTGFKGQVTQNGNGYAVHIIVGPEDQKKHAGLAKRMRNWYYYTHVNNLKTE